MVEDILRFRTLPFLDGSPYIRFNLHIKQADNRASQRRRGRMTEAVSVIGKATRKDFHTGRKGMTRNWDVVIKNWEGIESVGGML